MTTSARAAPATCARYLHAASADRAAPTPPPTSRVGVLFPYTTPELSTGTACEHRNQRADVNQYIDRVPQRNGRRARAPRTTPSRASRRLPPGSGRPAERSVADRKPRQPHLPAAASDSLVRIAITSSAGIRADRRPTEWPPNPLTSGSAGCSGETAARAFAADVGTRSPDILAS